MNSFLNQIFSNLKSENLVIRSNAVTDLALLLEMHSCELSYNQRLSRYSAYLDENLIGVILDRNEQQKIVNFLKSFILDRDILNASLIWAIGKSASDIGLTALLEITDHCLNFNDKELHELSISLGNLLFDGGTPSLCEQNKRTISQSNLVLFLENSEPTTDRTRTSLQGLLALVKEAMGAPNLGDYS